MLAWLHIYLLFVPPDLDHLPITQAIKPSTRIIGGAPHGRRISHHRRRDVALLRESTLLFPLQGNSAQWILRNAASQAEYEKHAKMPIIPLVVTPDGTGIQDSTPIIDQVEKLHPEPSIHPGDTVTRFISALIEEFGDEWGNKWMFHYRWARDVDQISSAGRIARMRAPDASEQEHDRVRRPGPRADGGPGLVRRLQRNDGAADRGRFSGDARPAGRPPRNTALSVWRATRLWRFRPLGPVLRNVDRSDRRRPDRGRRATRARLGASHAVAEGRRRIREHGHRWRRP